jgi:hypothetical protein
LPRLRPASDAYGPPFPPLPPQYSLDWFVRLFLSATEKAPKSKPGDALDVRLTALTSTFAGVLVRGDYRELPAESLAPPVLRRA